jgi:phosphoribosylglycinamide formyltransferase-1
MSFKIAVLASGNGSDLDAIYEEIDQGHLQDVEVSLVLSDKIESPALEKAKQRGIPAHFVDPKPYKNREDFDKALLSLIQGIGHVDLVCLIGYMRILTPNFTEAYRGRIINVHPSLLPKFGGIGWYGMKVHEAVLSHKEAWTGMTIHYVDFGVDSGPHVLQKKIRVEADDTPETLKENVQKLEKEAYPEAIRIIQAKQKDSRQLEEKYTNNKTT